MHVEPLTAILPQPIAEQKPNETHDRALEDCTLVTQQLMLGRYGNVPPKRINKVLDPLDVIREELLIVQRSIEKLATVESVVAPSKDGVPDCSDVRV